MTRDKKLVIGIAFSFILFSIISWFPNPETKDLVRTSLAIVLSVCLYLGYSWPRWVMGTLSVLAVLTCFISLTAISGNAGQLTILILMLAFYAYAAFYLLNPNLLKSHFRNTDE